MAVKTRERLTADERREQILEAARHEFAARGLYGTSTEDIAKRAGITQPYVFRLFGTKKQLFIAACDHCMEETHGAMRDAAVGKTGKEALEAMGHAYLELLDQDPRRLMLQMHMYAAAEDPDVGEAAEYGYGRLVEFVERASGEPPDAVWQFFATGMLINVIASMGLMKSPSPWAHRLLSGCGKDLS